MENGNGIVPRRDDKGGATDGAARMLSDTALAEVAPEGFSGLTKIVATVVCAALFLICIFPLAEFASSTQAHAASIEQLDAKAGNVTALIASSTAASVAITLLPGDVGSPIADKLVDLAADFAIVLGAIYLEKYLLTILGLAACRLVAPIALGSAIAFFWLRPDSPLRAKALSVAIRLALFAVALCFVIPLSVYVSGMIEQTYAYDASGVAAQIDSGAQTSESASDGAAASSDASQGSSAQSTSGSSENMWDQFVDWAGNLASDAADAASSAVEGVTSGATGVLDTAKSWVSSLVEAFAVMIVTCCVIPILVLVFFVWIINVLLGFEISVPAGAFAGAKKRLPRPGTKKSA